MTQVTEPFEYGYYDYRDDKLHPHADNPDDPMYDDTADFRAGKPIDAEPYQHREETTSKLAAHAADISLEDLLIPTEDSIEVAPYSEWKRDMHTWSRLGLDRYTAQDYRGLTSSEYDTWQRVVRNYLGSLKFRANTIRNAEGNVEFDYKIGRIYGTDLTASELLKYAASLIGMQDDLIERGIIDQSVTADMTKRKLQNAPDYEHVQITDKNGKLVLEITDNQKDVA